MPNSGESTYEVRCMNCGREMPRIESLGFAMGGGSIRCANCKENHSYSMDDGYLILRRIHVPLGFAGETERVFFPVERKPDSICVNREPVDLVQCPICRVRLKPERLESHRTRCTILEHSRREQRRHCEENRRHRASIKRREKQRQLDEAKTVMDEAERIDTQQRRKDDGQCIMCGAPLGFLLRLLKKDRHSHCVEFRHEHTEPEGPGYGSQPRRT